MSAQLSGCRRVVDGRVDPERQKTFARVPSSEVFIREKSSGELFEETTNQARRNQVPTVH